MEEQALQIAFDPGLRASADDVRRASRELRTHGLVSPLFDEIPSTVVILNRYRQIVYANRTALAAMSVSDPDGWLGLRPGEAFQCIHATETPDGCGSSKYCPCCGGYAAAAAAEAREQGVFECHVFRQNQLDAVDFRICSSGFRVNGEHYTLVIGIDVGHEVRRRALERIFFHDLLNATGNIEGLAYLLGHAESAGERDHLESMLKRSCERMADEIRTQRDIFEAEGGDLELDLVFCVPSDFARDLVDRYRFHPAARDKNLRFLEPAAVPPMIRTDPPLVGRVLGNLIKNALEATRATGTVAVAAEPAFDCRGVEFRIWNECAIPDEVQLRLFTRAFSTKGAGRGLGAYGAKLITERYLGGSLTFTSSPEAGTTFRVALPIEPPVDTHADF